MTVDIEGDDQQAPFRRSVGAAIITVVVLVELTLAAAWFQLTDSALALEEAETLSIAFTDSQRLFQEVEFLAATEPSFDTERVDTQLALLNRQLSVVATRLDDPTTSDQLAEDVRAVLAAFDELQDVRENEPTNVEDALALAARGQQTAQAAVDRTNRITRAELLDRALSAERTATIIAATGGLLLVTGAVLVWMVLLRYQRSFDEAWRIAAARRDALQATNEQLAALADTRERFVSVLSHELRSPLAVIGAAGETLHHHGDDLDPETRSGILQSLRRQVSRQQRMIDDLLMVAQHANAELDPRPTDVDVDDLLSLVREDELLEGHVITFDVEPGVRAHVDGHHLEQAVNNLVRNAEKYGGENIHVAAWTEGDVTVVTVSDDGEGVPPDLQPNLFEPYTHGDRDTQGGIGLGLSITRQLIEANGGGITYRTADGGGALFEVRVPATPVPSTPTKVTTGA